MNAAINVLEVQLMIYRNNLAINEDERNWAQVKLEREYVTSITKALKVLKALNSIVA